MSCRSTKQVRSGSFPGHESVTTHLVSPNFYFFSEDFFSRSNFNPQIFSLERHHNFLWQRKYFYPVFGWKATATVAKISSGAALGLRCYSGLLSAPARVSVSYVCSNEKAALRMVFPICNEDKALSLRHICCCYCFLLGHNTSPFKSLQRLQFLPGDQDLPWGKMP